MGLDHWSEYDKSTVNDFRMSLEYYSVRLFAERSRDFGLRCSFI